MASFFNLVAMTVSSAPGAGATIALGSAATINGVSYLSFANAGTPGGTSVDYSMLDTGASEIGTGTYLSSGPFLDARTPTKSTNGGAAINASSAAIVLCSPRAETMNDASVITTGTMAQARLGSGSSGAGAKALFDDQTYKTLAAIAQSGSATDLGIGTLPVARIGAKALDQTKINLNSNINPGPADLNTNFIAGLYAATGYLNSPDGAAATGNYWYVFVQQWDGATYTQQTAWRLTGGNQMYIRNQEAGAWSAWVRVMVGANNLSEITNAATARTNLGAGTVTSIVAGTGLSGGTITTSGTVALSLTNATLQVQPAAPTGTTSLAGVMMGLGSTCRITPVYSGRIRVAFYASVASGTATGYTEITLKYGTGAGPVNGAAITGTTVGTTIRGTAPFAGYWDAVATGGIITGLAPGTTYWFDVVLGGNSGTTATVLNINCNAMEF